MSGDGGSKDSDWGCLAFVITALLLIGALDYGNAFAQALIGYLNRH